MKRALVMVMVVAGGCSSRTDASSSVRGEAIGSAEVLAATAPTINPRLLRRFRPLRTSFDEGERTQAQIDLGRMLYFDARLSKNNDVSCNSCHPLDKYGADGQPRSKGTDGKLGKRNSPTVFHAAGQFASFWDGRAPDVEHQAMGPVTNPVEMAMTADEAVARLAAIPGYRKAFASAFPTSKDVTSEHIGIAIGAFERGLSTPARWDRYLQGDRKALTAEEVEGFKLFSDIGCVSCHTGELVGGSSFQKVGVIEPWPNQSDRGRYDLTHDKADDMRFKVPTLRNITHTAPYFHDGSVASLDVAVKTMARYQLGAEVSDTEVRLIVAWLDTLTGEVTQAYIAAPTLP
ncbi:MAG: cytochrome c peroxidase [Kofleriaceae bacterium]